jgi:anti-sigma-K factor RskA
VNVAEYISSGIIESYVLGLADAQEAAELEQMRATHPEVAAAITAFEESLEAHARANAIAPPDALKPKLMAAVQSEAAAPVVPVVPAKQPAKTISIRTWRLAAAASVILLIGSMVMNAYFANRISNMGKEQNELLAKNEELQQRAAATEDVAKMMADSAMLKIVMKNVPSQAAMMATVLWDSRNKDVYLFCNNMPVPAADKQYQLWAIVDGKPVDAGVLEMTKDGLRAVKMKNIPRAQAFAITLEKRGGSPTPNLEAMQVMGNT